MTNYGIDTNFKDILKMIYEREERYHNAKDRTIWLAGTAYFDLSIYIIKWILEKEKDWFSDNSIELCIPIAFLGIICFFVY